MCAPRSRKMLAAILLATSAASTCGVASADSSFTFQGSSDWNTPSNWLGGVPVVALQRLSDHQWLGRYHLDGDLRFNRRHPVQRLGDQQHQQVKLPLLSNRQLVQRHCCDHRPERRRIVEHCRRGGQRHVKHGLWRGECRQWNRHGFQRIARRRQPLRRHAHARRHRQRHYAAQQHRSDQCPRSGKLGNNGTGIFNQIGGTNTISPAPASPAPARRCRSASTPPVPEPMPWWRNIGRYRPRTGRQQWHRVIHSNRWG